MKYSKDHMDRLKAVLASAHLSKAAAPHPVDNRWRQSVMRSVRGIGSLKQYGNQRSRFSQLAWQLAPAALALMIILGVMIFKVDDTLDYELGVLMVSDPVQTYMTFEPL